MALHAAGGTKMAASRVRVKLGLSSLRPLASVVGFTAACALASAAYGSAGSYAIPDHLTLDKLGVDIGSLEFERSDTFLTIGDPADGGLAWAFVGHSASDPYDGVIVAAMSPATPVQEIQAKIGGHVTVFIHCETGACQNMSGTGSTLVKTASNWTYTTEDGSVYTFDAPAYTIDQYDPVAVAGKLLTISRPTGAVVTINYTSSNGIQSVVSSRGYALQYTGNANGGTTISAVNLASHTCDGTVTTCDGVDSSITISAPFNVVSGVDGQTYYSSQITDATGRNWLYAIYPIPTYDPLNQYFAHDGIRYFKSPDGYEASMTYDQAGRITGFTDNRGNWTYSYPDETLYEAEHGRTDHVISVTDPSGALLYTAHADSSDSWTDYVQDPNGNETQFGSDGASYTDGYGVIDYARLHTLTKPELNVRTWTHDSRGNVSAVTDTPKPNSGLTSIILNAAYPPTCSNPITCNKPTSTTDAKGNETDFTYDPTHGGILSEMRPAPAAGAARPLKLTTWAQKTPYYKNSSGTLVASSTPIWEVSTVTECQTVAGSNSPVCDSAAPKRVTTYEYGANGTANALWPHGIAVTADGTTRRTCYSYDALGNKISQTSPRAALASCP